MPPAVTVTLYITELEPVILKSTLVPAPPLNDWHPVRVTVTGIVVVVVVVERVVVGLVDVVARVVVGLVDVVARVVVVVARVVVVVARVVVLVVADPLDRGDVVAAAGPVVVVDPGGCASVEVGVAATVSLAVMVTAGAVVTVAWPVDVSVPVGVSALAPTGTGVRRNSMPVRTSAATTATMSAASRLRVMVCSFDAVWEGWGGGGPERGGSPAPHDWDG